MSPVDMPGIIAFSSMSTISTGLHKFFSISCLTISTSIIEAVQLLRAILIVSVPEHAGAAAVSAAAVSSVATSVALSLPPHAANNNAPAANKPTVNFLFRNPIFIPLIWIVPRIRLRLTLAILVCNR